MKKDYRTECDVGDFRPEKRTGLIGTLIVLLVIAAAIAVAVMKMPSETSHDAKSAPTEQKK